MGGSKTRETDLGDGSGFVVPSYQLYSIGVSEFQACEEGDGFDGEETSIDVVAYNENQ